MNSIVRRSVFLCLFVMQTPAWAIDAAAAPTPAPAPAPATMNGYWGIGYDAVNFRANRNGVLAQYPTLSSGTEVQPDSSNMSGIFGWRMDEHLAMQIDMIGFGSIRATDNGVSKQLFSPTLLTISAIMSQALSERVSVFGKLGGSYWYLTEQNAQSSVNDGFGLSYGAGVDFNLYGGKERMLRLEWTHYKMDGVLLDSADGLSLGALFSF